MPPAKTTTSEAPAALAAATAIVPQPPIPEAESDMETAAGGDDGNEKRNESPEHKLLKAKVYVIAFIAN